MSGARVNDYPILWPRNIVWIRPAGTSPAKGEFVLRKADASSLRKGGYTPVALTVGSMQAQKLYVTGFGRAEHPDMTTVQLQDLRAMWPRVSIKPRFFNITRPTGSKTFASGVVGDLQGLVANIGYRKKTLKGGTALWSQAEMLLSIMEDVRAEIVDRIGADWGFAIAPAPRRPAPVTNLSFLQDTGLSAIIKALREVAGVTLNVSLDGNVEWEDVNDHADIDLIRRSRPIAGPLLAAVTDNSNVRASRVRIRIQRELELKFISRAEDGTTVASPPGEAPLEAVNVYSNPDPELVAGGRTRAAGEFVEKGETLAAWASLPRRTGTPELTRSIIRRLWAGRRLHQQYSSGFPGIPPDVDWLRRIQTVYACDRQLYQIPDAWRDVIRSYRLQRAGIIDPATGTWAPSRAYVDYAVVWNQVPDFLDASDDDYCALNVDGYAENLADAQEFTQAHMAEVDHDLMTFKVVFDVSAWGGVGEVYPSQIDPATVPQFRVGRFGNRKFLAIDQEGAMVLAEEHQLAFVLTAMPWGGEPYDIELDAPAGVDANGPPVDIWISPDLVTARHGWADGEGPRQRALFFGRSGGNMDDLLIDREEIYDLAHAVRDRYYQEMADTGVGTLVLPGMRTDIKTGGSLGTVTYEAGTDGVQQTTATFGRPRAPLPIVDQVGLATREKLFRFVRQGGD